MNLNASLAKWRERYRVRIGFIFALVFIWQAQPRILFLILPGFLISFIGILLRQWAAGFLKKNDELATTGPYALVRNPLYLGSLLAACGLILSCTSFPFSLSKPYLDLSLFFWCFLWLLIQWIYFPKISKEEEFLKLKFPQVYEDYAQRVPAICPKFSSLLHLDFGSFRWELWIKNKEVWSLIGYFILCAILTARYPYLH